MDDGRPMKTVAQVVQNTTLQPSSMKREGLTESPQAAGVDKNGTGNMNRGKMENTSALNSVDYLRNLWQNIAKCNSERASPDGPTQFEPSKFYGNIYNALGNVEVLLNVLQEIKKGDNGKVKAVTAEPDSHPLTIFRDRRDLYRRAASRMRSQAAILANTLERMETFLLDVAKPLSEKGFQVEWHAGDNVWIVDYGYKQMFSKFEAHLDCITDRDHYAVVDYSRQGELSFKSCKETECRLVHNADGQAYGLPNLFSDFDHAFDLPITSDQPSSNPSKIDNLLRELYKRRQMILERDLYDYIVSKDYASASVGDTIELVQNIDPALDLPISSFLLTFLRQYLQ